VRVLDKNGVLLGEMSTAEGIGLAKLHGMDLQLIDYDNEPVTCVIADDKSLSELAGKHSTPDDYSSGFSFDPTLRPSTIRFSSQVADEDFERKIDILRNHLLDKRRCNVEIFTRNDLEVDEEATQRLTAKILDDIRDIAKLADDSGLDQESSRYIRFKIWPCNSEQTTETPLFQLPNGDQSEQETELDSSRPRRVRIRLDPKLNPPNFENS
jgi:translation initiation factor IF-3